MAGSGDYRWIAEDEQTDVYGGFNNTFNFNHGWMASVEMNYQSKGDMENYSETKNIFYVDAGVTKFFWGIGCL